MTNPRVTRTLVATLGVAALVFASCGQAASPTAAAPAAAAQKSAPAAQSTATAAPVSVASATAAAPGTVRRIDLVLSDTAITPTNIDVKAGERVLLVAKNIGGEKHNLVALTGATFVSPDAYPGQVLEYPWAAPLQPQSIKVVCAYHPDLTFTFTVK